MIKMQVIKSGTAPLGNPSLMWVDTSDSYTVKVWTDNGWQPISSSSGAKENIIINKEDPISEQKSLISISEYINDKSDGLDLIIYPKYEEDTTLDFSLDSYSGDVNILILGSWGWWGDINKIKNKKLIFKNFNILSPNTNNLPIEKKDYLVSVKYINGVSKVTVETIPNYPNVLEPFDLEFSLRINNNTTGSYEVTEEKIFVDKVPLIIDLPKLKEDEKYLDDFTGTLAINNNIVMDSDNGQLIWKGINYLDILKKKQGGSLISLELVAESTVNQESLVTLEAVLEIREIN